jgi:D-alanyl-D-alanine carboxypeptidase (penicillin-binding protein 5/6)
MLCWLQRTPIRAIAVLCLAPLLIVIWPSLATASPNFSRGKFAAIAIDDATGDVLYQRQADAVRYPASLTKVMTLYLIYDAIERGDLKLTDKVTISPRAAARPPSKLGLRAGDHLTVAEALDVLVVKSANDIATALAERIAGTEAAFAAQMTRRARELGMAHTRFRNASGLPDHRHVSTARDLALLARSFLRDHPAEYRVFDQEKTTFRGRVIRGHNALLSRPGIDGFKTGFTNASGFNLLTSGAREGHRVVAVVLGGGSAAGRDRFMRDLLRASFASLAIRDAGTTLRVATLLGAKDPLPKPDAKALQLAAGDRYSRSSFTDSPAQGDAETVCEDQTPGCWWVQVGAFKSPERTKAYLTEISTRHPRRFGAAPRRIDPIGQVYQARFAGFSAAGAKAACDVIVAEGGDCLAMANGL